MGLYGIYRMLSSLVDFYELLIVIWCVLSWVPTNEYGALQDFREVLGKIIRPYLDLFRRFIPPMGGVDFSPILAILVLNFLQRGLYLLLL
ncbi:MAG: YggT family protein [Atopobiaceae bacterium]|nr:YggT family protein [Atopobiaceae bacterium]